MLKIENFTDVCMTGGMHYTPSHTNVSKFYNFQHTFFSADISPEMLKLGRVTKVKVLFLVLVFVFNFDLFKFSAAILEKGLLSTLLRLLKKTTFYPIKYIKRDGHPKH